MPIFKNARGDRLTVDCGGFGGDNVLGTVEENAGNSLLPVAGAMVVVVNLTNGDSGQALTNANGVFDIDMDAACNHRIKVVATWTAQNGLHRILATFSCPPCEKPAEIPDSAARQKTLQRLEQRGLEQIDRMVTDAIVLASLQEEAAGRVVAEVNALSAGGDTPEARRQLDGMMHQELSQLLRKMEQARQAGPVPPNSLQWAILEEVVQLLQKMVLKVFWLQGKSLPPLPEPPRQAGIEA